MKKLIEVKVWLPILMLAAVLAGCNKSETISGGGRAPVITFRSDDHVYKVKTGRDTTLRPDVANGEGAEFLWMLDKEGDGNWTAVGSEPYYTFSTSGLGLSAGDQCFLKLRVTNGYGSSEEEVRVDVVELALPVVSFGVSGGGVDVVAGREYLFEPEVGNAENATFGWTLKKEGEADAAVVGTERTYAFMERVLGKYTLTLSVRNDDGEGSGSVEVNVVEALPVTAVFLPSMWGGDASKKSVMAGRTIYLRPFVTGAANPSYSWSVDGVPAGKTSSMFAFTPSVAGDYEVTVTVADNDASQAGSLSYGIRATGRSTVSATVRVECTDTDHRRQAGSGSQAGYDKVFEYVPAPGQFINETLSGYNNETTMEQACAYAESRLAAGRFVSLGGFGGYIVLGFDHSIVRRSTSTGPASSGDCDFSVSGNQFDGASEPGIVWVMQDTNGNGEPDDEWYEVRGSEYGKDETWQDYAVTYFAPNGSRQNVQWKDSRGNRGTVDVNTFHMQDSYYPSWIGADSYTLYGTCLKSRTYYEPSQYKWVHGSFGWGYVDNAGSDSQTVNEGAGEEVGEAAACKTYFRIANAVTAAGTPAGLEYIDFVKVQVGVNVKAPVIGEASTEVLGAKDEGLGR